MSQQSDVYFLIN